jgi:hypothetical protein
MIQAAAEIERLRAALEWIDQQRYTGRCTINLANGYDRAAALNEKLIAVMDVARAALAQEARDEPKTDRRYNVAERLFGDD